MWGIKYWSRDERNHIFSIMCLILCFVFFSCLQIPFSLPRYFLFHFLPHHAVMYQLWLCPFAAAVKFLTLFCSFTDTLRCEGGWMDRAASSVTHSLTHSLVLPARAQPGRAAEEPVQTWTALLKDCWLSALFQAVRVSSFLRRDRIQTV